VGQTSLAIFNPTTADADTESGIVSSQRQAQHLHCEVEHFPEMLERACDDVKCRRSLAPYVVGSIFNPAERGKQIGPLFDLLITSKRPYTVQG